MQFLVPTPRAMVKRKVQHRRHNFNLEKFISKSKSAAALKNLEHSERHNLGLHKPAPLSKV